ncbi:hypothetical protein [Streptomyces sp. NPDC015131]|uniref:hypothetical protein n=1 Tax=Streptomyces sp. NPDC015131 TaxID=3364941 RepID=UPI0036FF0B46
MSDMRPRVPWTQCTRVLSLCDGLAALPAAQRGADLAEARAVLAAGQFPPPNVGPDALPMEVAALVAPTPSPLIAVIEREADHVCLLGAVTAARFMSFFLSGTAPAP